MGRILLPSVAFLACLALAVGEVRAEPRQLSLEEIIAAAQKNPLARMARENTLAAEARAREAKGRRWVSVEGTGFLAPSPRIECDNEDCTQTSPDDLAINIAGVFGGISVDLTQPLYTSGKLSSIHKAARQAARATRQLEDEALGQLATRSAQAYYGLKLARETIFMLEEGAEQIAEGKETLETKLAEGASDVTLQDRFRLETLQAEVAARLSEAREAERVALAAIRALVGEPEASVDDEILAAVDFELPGEDGQVPTTPTVRAAQLGVQSLESMVDFERAQYFPDLVVRGGGNYAKAQGVDNPPSAFANDRFNTSSMYVALGLRWQLEPFAQPARVERRRAEKRRAQAAFRAASAESKLRWRQALARAREAKKRLEVAENGARSGRSWVASVLQADAVGAASAKDFADAYISYFTQRGRMLRSIYDWNLAIAELRRLLGEFTTR